MTRGKRTLLNIDEDMMALDDLLAEAGGDISDPEVEKHIEAIVAELEQDLTNKADGYAAYIKELNARAKARKEESDRLAQRAKQDAASADFLKQRLQAVLEKHGHMKLETTRFRLSVANNGGKPPVRVEVETESLPEHYQQVTRRPDTEKLREALENGQQIPGVRLEQRGRHLRIN